MILSDMRQAPHAFSPIGTEDGYQQRFEDSMRQLLESLRNLGAVYVLGEAARRTDAACSSGKAFTLSQQKITPSYGVFTVTGDGGLCALTKALALPTCRLRQPTKSCCRRDCLVEVA